MTIARVAVIGAGTMGHGIAYAAAAAGCEVMLFDATSGAAAAALQRIGGLIESGIARGKLAATDRAAIAGRIHPAASLGEAGQNAELAIEAVVEDMSAKRDVFAALDAAVPARGLLATNTSSLSVAALAAVVSDPGRVVGMHFFNPVPAMKLVEVVIHPGTRRDVEERAVGFVHQLAKEPIVVKDSPGFASSRLGVALGLEAMRMLEEGVASAEDIDKAMELGYNHPVGPLKLTDLVGLDVRLAIAEYLHRTLEDARFEPPGILRAKVARGELGKKSGRGFYVWSA